MNEYVPLRRPGAGITLFRELSPPLCVHFGGPKMDEKGLAGRKWPEARGRSTEIYRTRPTASGSGKINFGRSASAGLRAAIF